MKNTNRVFPFFLGPKKKNNIQENSDEDPNELEENKKVKPAPSRYTFQKFLYAGPNSPSC